MSEEEEDDKEGEESCRGTKVTTYLHLVPS